MIGCLLLLTSQRATYCHFTIYRLCGLPLLISLSRGLRALDGLMGRLDLSCSDLRLLIWLLLLLRLATLDLLVRLGAYDLNLLDWFII